MRGHDWAGSPLGGVEGWPQSLRTATSIILNSKYPMFIAWGPQLAFLYNDGYRPIFGAKHPAALGRPFAEVWAEIWSDVRPLVDRALVGEPTWSDDLGLFMERSGYVEEVYFTFSYSPIRDETGGVGGMFCACTETTGKVIGERRLRCLRDLAASAVDAKRVVDAERLSMEVIQSNPADIPFALLYRLADGDSARLVASAGVSPADPIAPSTLSGPDGGWPPTGVAHGETVIVRDLPSRFGGVPSSVWGDPVDTALMVPIPDRGQEASSAALVLGVNPRRALDADYRSFLDLVAANVATSVANAGAFEEERGRAEALAELDRAKTLFFSNVSHEFRTPLTLMLGPLEEVLRRHALPEDVRNELAVSHRNGLRLLKLVNTLLDFSRVEAGRAKIVLRPTDLASFTADLASQFASACETAGLRLTVDCPALPAPVLADRDVWEKIVLNLVSNAFKFTFEGDITVTMRARDDGAELTVRDTGIGIAESELPHIFERFHRVEGAQGRTHEGTGIGLALVKELVGLHGGTIRVASVPGQGTTFTVRVPLAPARRADGPEPEPPAAVTARADAYVDDILSWLPGSAGVAVAGDGGSGLRSADGRRPAVVLLADDNADMRDYVSRLLAPSYTVEAVADGWSALEAARACRPDLVLSDVMMPRLDGFGLLAALREDPALRSVPFVLLSARAGEEARSEGLEAGADDYLVKPFTARELLARVRSQIAMATLRRETEEHLRMLLDELNHRVKNTLATVQAIVAQALRGAPVAGEVRRAVESRLVALAKSHDLLTRENWGHVDLRDVAEHAVAPFTPAARGRIVIEGAPTRLRPKLALALGMAFHELATNATKYGALSNVEGRVAIRWEVESERLRLRWEERGGPPVATPSRKGFGSKLVERGLAREFGGAVTLDFAPEGVTCAIEMPIPPSGGRR